MPHNYSWTPTKLVPTNASQVKVLTVGDQPAALSTPVSVTGGTISFALTNPGRYKIAIQKGSERYTGLFDVDTSGTDVSKPEQYEYTRTAPIDTTAPTVNNSYSGSILEIIGSQLEDKTSPTRKTLSVNYAEKNTQLRPVNYLQSAADAATWDVTTGTGTVTTSSTNTLLITSASGTAQGVRRVSGFDLKMGGAIHLRLKRDTNLSVLDFRVRTASYSAPKIYSANLGVAAIPVGEWYDFVFPLAASSSLPATPLASDINKIVGIDIQVTPTAGTVTTLEVESITITDGDPRPGICFQFDDGRADTYSIAYPILKSAGYRGSIAIEHTAVGNANRCTQAQLNTMYSDGWSYLGHHTAQMTSLSASDQNLVHQASKDYLLNNNFTRGVNHWVWPGGARNVTTDKIARKYWKTRRAVSPMIPNAASVGTSDPYDPNVFYILATTTTAAVKTRIDQVARTGGVLVLVFHSIVAANATAEDYLTSNFQEIVDYAKSKNLQDFTYDEVFDPRQPQRVSQ